MRKAVCTQCRSCATNTQTRVITTTKTNESGVRNLPYLNSGPTEPHHRARLEGDGGNRRGGGPNNISRIDRTLELGSITESITVEAAAPLLQQRARPSRGSHAQVRGGSLPAVGGGA
jgi:hypothetical protein